MDYNQWGTVYKQDLDQLRVNVKPETTESLKERLIFEISKNGEVSLEWGETEVEFDVK